MGSELEEAGANKQKQKYWKEIYMSASHVHINVLHPKGIRTNLFFQGMQVVDPLLGEVLHCSFSMSIRLLEVSASNS